MKVISTDIPDVKIINLDKHGDERGFFIERFNKKSFASLGIDFDPVQINHSLSSKGVLRGLHYQKPYQGKIVGCITGSILDVAVDIRPNSQTFGKHIAIEIDNPQTLVYIPGSFAHGFTVLSESCHLMYFVDEFYSPEGDGGIHYDSCGVNWGVSNPTVSPKDKNLPTFNDLFNSTK